MKMKRKLTALAMTGIATVAALTCGITATACGGTKILATPTNLQIADDILTWDEVPNAKSYMVDINGEEYQTQTNSLDILEITNQPITYAFSVYAIGDYEKTFDSDRSEEIEYVVPQPINLEYKKLDDGTCSVYATDAREPRAEMTGKLIIPEVSPDGYVVTSIEANGFRECIALTSIYMPDSIDKIGENAFTYCTSATRIRLSEYITSVADYTFCNSAIKQIEIPAGVTQIGNVAFGGCKQLSEIEIPAGVTQIGEEAFAKCKQLSEIKLNEGLKEIGCNSFYQCNSLTSITFPNTYESYESGATYGCENLSEIKMAQGENAEFKSDGNCIIRKSDNSLVLGCRSSRIPGYVKSIGNSAFAYCYGLSQISLPEGVETIGVSAFKNCTGLTEVSIPQSVETIGVSAFYYCTGLKEISIPQNVKTIGGAAFSGCAGLKEISIPQSVKKIEGYAFSDCTGLTNVTVPEGVTEIEIFAFRNCQSLESVSLPSTLQTLNERWIALCTRLSNLSVAEGNPYYKSVGNCILTKDGGTLVSGCAGSVIPDCVTTIGRGAFFGQTGLKEVVIPDGVTKICESAFCNCENLRAVFIPSSVETIEYDAFAGCFYASVTVPDSVTNVRDTAFEHCVIYNPNDVTPEGWYERLDNIYYFYSVFWNGWYGQNVRGSQIRYDGAYPYVYSIVYFDNYTRYSGVPALSVPYRQGYTFLGWTTEEGGDKPLYGTRQASFTFRYKSSPGGLIELKTEIENLIIADIPKDNLTLLPEIKLGTVLYAVWEKND